MSSSSLDHGSNYEISHQKPSWEAVQREFVARRRNDGILQCGWSEKDEVQIYKSSTNEVPLMRSSRLYKKSKHSYPQMITGEQLEVRRYSIGLMETKLQEGVAQMGVEKKTGPEKLQTSAIKV
ncbi:hypothetical protein TNCV_5034741 [Trichonephila clavipes]|nr:hypothetical protein TNCV_5034741 [Trichonephila clavipes]